MAVNDLVGDALHGPYTPEQLFAGEAKPVTNQANSLVAAIAKYEYVALTATGITTFVPGTHTFQQGVVAAQPITGIGQACPYYAAGFFNHAAIVWPAGTALDTLAERKAFCGNGPIQVGALL